MTNMKNIAASVAAATAIAGIYVLASPTTTAQADPGRCGVSVQGPSNSGSQWAYFVRNDCSSNIHVKVQLYTLGQETPCKWIVPGETVALFSNFLDGTWQAVAC
ncbi:hypothetical protein [Nocardia sp. XZ_19_369]|uniref:hypothetical protein n=1 Tax=Nocardia sp. XZ_19_369 TaxID=2769487 RepID=UPI00188F006B|nr:hypothetical protein [Nocardia sp. XZ_19_369]